MQIKIPTEIESLSHKEQNKMLSEAVKFANLHFMNQKRKADRLDRQVKKLKKELQEAKDEKTKLMMTYEKKKISHQAEFADKFKNHFDMKEGAIMQVLNKIRMLINTDSHEELKDFVDTVLNGRKRLGA
jgi:hypothetical protein